MLWLRRGSVNLHPRIRRCYCTSLFPFARTTMTRMRRLMWGLPVAGALAVGGLFLAQRGESAPERANGGNVVAKPADLKPAVSLPISQVILFNSGVGHFTRSG